MVSSRTKSTKVIPDKEDLDTNTGLKSKSTSPGAKSPKLSKHKWKTRERKKARDQVTMKQRSILDYTVSKSPNTKDPWESTSTERTTTSSLLSDTLVPVSLPSNKPEGGGAVESSLKPSQDILLVAPGAEVSGQHSGLDPSTPEPTLRSGQEPRRARNRTQDRADQGR